LTPELFINTLQKIEDLTVPAASSVDIMKPTEEIIKVIQNTQRIRELR
jgi:hypothetical protein